MKNEAASGAVRALFAAGILAASAAVAGGLGGCAQRDTPAAAPVSTAVSAEVWGKLPDGREARLFTLENSLGLRVRICELGAAITSIEAPDRDGRSAAVTPGYDDLAAHAADGAAMGVIVGRVANRIAGAKFTLDGATYPLAANNAPGGLPCSLHGGRHGFNRRLWRGEITRDKSGAPGVTLAYRSAAGEEGYPGNLDVEAAYTLRGNALEIRFRATCDAPTPVNLAQHTYFNLAGTGGGGAPPRDILDHTLQIAADTYLPVNAGLIPTGEFAPVAGTPFDFREPRRIGGRIADTHPQLRLGGGYDHCFALRNTGGGFAARLRDPASGRTLTVETSEPGLQLYTGNGLAGVRVRDGARLPRHGAVALEAQHYPDSPNQPNFPSVILRPGAVFESRTVFRFTAE